MSKEQPAQPPRKWRFRTLLIVASILVIGACGIAVKSFWPARVPNHSPLIRIVNFPGVEKPVFREQSKMKMAANAEIAGFVIKFRQAPQQVTKSRGPGIIPGSNGEVDARRAGAVHERECSGR